MTGSRTTSASGRGGRWGRSSPPQPYVPASTTAAKDPSASNPCPWFKKDRRALIGAMGASEQIRFHFATSRRRADDQGAPRCRCREPAQKPGSRLVESRTFRRYLSCVASRRADVPRMEAADDNNPLLRRLHVHPPLDCHLAALTCSRPSSTRFSGVHLEPWRAPWPSTSGGSSYRKLSWRRSR